MTKRTRSVYDDAFRFEVLSDYHASGLSASLISKKWGIHINTLKNWLLLYPIDLDSLSLGIQPIIHTPMDHSEEIESPEQTSEGLLKEENLRLRKALEMEKLRSRAFEKMIELTEREEGICILKKDGAKQ